MPEENQVNIEFTQQGLAAVSNQILNLKAQIKEFDQPAYTQRYGAPRYAQEGIKAEVEDMKRQLVYLEGLAAKFRETLFGGRGQKLSAADIGITELREKFKQSNQAIDQLLNKQKEAGGTAKEVAALGVAWDKVFAVITNPAFMAAAVAVGATFAGIAAAIAKGIPAAREQEQSVQRLNIALQSMGAYSAQASLAAQQFADTLKRQSRFSDQAILSAQALIAQLGRLTGRELEEATQGAVNLAVALNRNLGTAALIVAKAAQGSTFELRKYGLVIDRNIPKAERFAKVMEFLKTKFGGVAQAEMRTFSATMEQFGNAVTDVFEVIGAPIIESLTPVIRRINLALFDYVDAAKAARQQGQLFPNLDPQGDVDRFIKSIDKIVSGGDFMTEAWNVIQFFDMLSFTMRQSVEAGADINAMSFDSLQNRLNSIITTWEGFNELRAEQAGREVASIKGVVELIVTRSSFDDVQRFIRSIEEEVDKLDQLDPKFPWLNALAVMAREAVNLRVEIDDTQAIAVLSDIEQRLFKINPPGGLEFSVTAQPKFEEAEREINAILRTPRFVKWIAQFDDTDLDALKSNEELNRVKELAYRIVIDKNATREDLKANNELILESLERLAADASNNMSAAFRASDLISFIKELQVETDRVAKRLVDAETIGRIDKLRDRIRGVTTEVGEGLSLVSFDEIRRSDNLTQSLQRLGPEIEKLFSTQDPEKIRRQLDDLFRLMASLQLPGSGITDEARAEIDRFIAEMEPKLRMEFDIVVRIDKIRKQFEEAKDLATRILAGLNVDLNLAETISFEAQLGTAESLADTYRAARQRLAEFVNDGNIGGVKNALRAISAELRKVSETDPENTLAIEYLKSLKKAAEDAAKTLGPLDAILEKSKLLQLKIDQGDLEGATQLREEITRLRTAAEAPIPLPVVVDVDAVNAALRDAKLERLEVLIDLSRPLDRELQEAKAKLDRFKLELSEIEGPIDIQVLVEIRKQETFIAKLEGMNQRIEQAKQGITDLGEEVVATFIGAPFQSALDGTRSWADSMAQIFINLVDQIIAELSRLGALTIFRALLKLGNQNANTGSFDVLGDTPEVNIGKAGFDAGFGGSNRPSKSGGYVLGTAIPASLPEPRSLILGDLSVRSQRPAVAVNLQVNAIDAKSVAQSFKYGALRDGLRSAIRASL